MYKYIIFIIIGCSTKCNVCQGTFDNCIFCSNGLKRSTLVSEDCKCAVNKIIYLINFYYIFNTKKLIFLTIFRINITIKKGKKIVKNVILTVQPAKDLEPVSHVVSPYSKLLNVKDLLTDMDFSQ